jgi:thiamine pyrophosphate-dependent acetolactate synthase large subunit-like protein
MGPARLTVLAATAMDLDVLESIAKDGIIPGHVNIWNANGSVPQQMKVHGGYIAADTETGPDSFERVSKAYGGAAWNLYVSVRWGEHRTAWKRTLPWGVLAWTFETPAP